MVRLVFLVAVYGRESRAVRCSDLSPPPQTLG